MKYKTYTFRAYPNKTQAKLIFLTFLMCRYIFNTLLRFELDNYSKYCSKVEESLKNKIDFDEKNFSIKHKIPKISLIKKQMIITKKLILLLFVLNTATL